MRTNQQRFLLTFARAGWTTRQPSTITHRNESDPISASSVGIELFTLPDRAVDAVVEMFRQRTGVEPHRELRQRIA
jgi:hypothetical protein